MKSILSFALLVLLLSCSNNASSPSAADTTATQEYDGSELEQPEADKSQYYIWDVNSDEKTITQNPQLRPDYYSVDTLLMGLNEKYPQVQLEQKRIGHDTLYTEIKNAQYLTEQMGSAGAEQYIAQAVVNLTSVKGINFVRIDFAAGSHTEPDVWSKESFSGYKTVKE